MNLKKAVNREGAKENIPAFHKVFDSIAKVEMGLGESRIQDFCLFLIFSSRLRGSTDVFWMKGLS
jgi:hypothetical protein